MPDEWRRRTELHGWAPDASRARRVAAYADASRFATRERDRAFLGRSDGVRHESTYCTRLAQCSATSVH